MVQMRRKRLLIGVLMLALAFAVGCLIFRQILPFPDIPTVRAKREHFLANANRYDTLFIGSSRINHQVIPPMFDELTARAGRPTKTFNAGVAGMRPPEDSYFFDQLLAAKPRNLRWVFIELSDIQPRINNRLRGTMRAQYWHDAPRLWLIWKRLSNAKEGRRRNLRALWRDWSKAMADFPEHLDLFVKEMSNLGKGDFLAAQLLARGGDPFGLPYYLGPDLSGWRPSGRGEELSPVERAIFDKELADRLAKPAVRDHSDDVSQQALETMIAKVERLGAQPVLLLTPQAGKRSFFPRPERAARTIVIDFNDPVRCPELFEHRHRLDSDHLNSAGAEVFTRMLAEHWLAAVKARGEAR